jgi:hypothetical protein
MSAVESGRSVSGKSAQGQRPFARAASSRAGAQLSKVRRGERSRATERALIGRELSGNGDGAVKGYWSPPEAASPELPTTCPRALLGYPAVPGLLQWPATTHSRPPVVL